MREEKTREIRELSSPPDVGLAEPTRAWDHGITSNINIDLNVSEKSQESMSLKLLEKF